MEKYKSNSEAQNKHYYNNHPGIIERFDTSKNGSSSLQYKDCVNSSIKFRDVSLSILLEEENSNNMNKQFL
jgi:hypothetical protein